MPPSNISVSVSDSAVSASEVRAALDKILTSPELSASPQLCAFLAYVVEARLAGNEHLLKGQNIGTAVLGRAEGFDSQRDPIVRVEANRLRRSLVSYYQGSGANDDVRIIVGRGSYVPRLERYAVPQPEPRQAEPVAEAPPKGRDRRQAIVWACVALASIAIVLVVAFLRIEPRQATTVRGAAVAAPPVAAAQPGRPYLPSIEVMPFVFQAAGTAGGRGRELASTLTVALARFPELQVLSGGSQEADFRIDGEIAVGDPKSTVAMRLSATDTADVIWSANIEMTRDELMSSAGIDRAVAVATTAIAPQFGAVARHLSRDDRAKGRDGALASYKCMIDAQLQHPRFDDGAWQKLDQCLRETIERFPNFATAAASRALLLIEEYRLNPRQAPAQAALLEADQLARRSLQLEPSNVRAMTAVVAVSIAEGDLETARNIGLRAITANPLDPLSRSQYVLALIASGYFDPALEQLAMARRIDPAHAASYDSLEYLAHFGEATQPNPVAHAVMADVPLAPYGAMARVLAYNSSGDVAARRQAIRALSDIMPLFAEDMPAALRRQFPASPFTLRLQAALQKAGVGG